MSFAKYLKAGNNPGMTRGRGYNMRGSYRGDGDGGGWGGRGGRGRGNNFSGPSRGRSNRYKEHPGGFEQRGRYPSEGGDERYSGRGHVEDPSYRRYPRQETSGYSGREHGHHRSPEESPRKRMKTDHGYMQASSSRRSHEGSYSEYNRYSFSEDKGYGEERRSYRDDRRSYREHSHGDHGGYGSRDEYSHRKERLEADRGESSVMEGRHPPLRGSYRGRSSERGRLRRVLRGVPRVVIVRRADGMVLKRRSIVDHPYSVRKRIISARSQEYLKKLRNQKFRRLREAEGEEVDEEKEEELISDDEDKEEDNWDELEKAEDDDFDDFDEGVEEVKSVKEDKDETEKEESSKKKEEETEEKPKEAEGEEEEGNKETKKPETEKPEKTSVQVTIKHDSDSRAVNEDELAELLPKNFIRLHCPHCNVRCITFREYGVHLFSSEHANTMRRLALKHKLYLERMRTQQRINQRKEEERDEELGVLPMLTTYCQYCQVRYRISRKKHQESNLHRMLMKFLMPFCRVCNVNFQTPMQYENHMCSVLHMQRKWKADQRLLRQKELDLEAEHEAGSGLDGEDKDLDLDNFMIVDSVGDVDETGDEAGESGTKEKMKEKPEKKRKEEEKKKEVRLGKEYIKKVEVLFCELCRRYLPRLDQPERAISLHCRTSLHLECYRDDMAMRKEADRIHRREMERKKNEEAFAKKAAKKTEVAKEKSENGEKDEAQNNDSEEKKTDETTESPKTEGETSNADGETANDEPKQGVETEDLDSAMDEKMWADVDKDLGEILREVEPSSSTVANEGEVITIELDEDEDEEDSRAEGEERYDRFRYSEKGGGGSVVEEHVPTNETTVTKPEIESEPTTETPALEESANSDSKKDEAETEENDV